MIRIAVAFSGETGRQTLCRALETRGLAPRFRCHTGAEAIRAVKTMGGGVVVCGARLSDMTAGEVAEALAGEGLVIAVGHASQLAACGEAPFLKLAAPLNAGTLAGAVQSALARDNARVPSRSEAEREAVSRAKAMLMTRQNMTEPQAHRALQRYAMDRGIKMSAAAEKFLREAAD